jgi:NADPH-dependent FMN reductase/SCP-2 sterol transfer family
LNKARQVFLYIAPFPPLAFFKIWASLGQGSDALFYVACLMLLYCGFVIWLASRWDRPSYFDWTVGAYFAAVTFSLLLMPEPAGEFLKNYSVTGIYTCLFAAAFLPPLFGLDPFTYHYAKKSTPEVFWENPIFVRINLIMTYIWAGVFALCIALSLYPSVVTRAILPLGLILGFGLPFNLRFPNWYLKRLGLPTLAEQKKMASGWTKQIKPAKPGFEQKEPAREEVPYEVPIPGKEQRMRVLALNSSPRGDGQSKTELMLTHLVKGMAEAGAEVEVVDLRRKSVKHCIGCYTCWTKTPGVCIHKDDMTHELFPKWRDADLVVYATPLYHFTLNATMKAFIERTLPFLEPYLEDRDGETAHPARYKHPKVVFLSVAGFPEISAFAQLSSWANFVFGRHGRLAAEIYRPMAEGLKSPFLLEETHQVLQATAQAGREIIQNSKISPDTLKRITRPLVDDPKPYFRMANLFWKTCIAEGVSPKEFAEKGMIPRPDSVEAFMFVMPMGFNPETAGDTRATIQFKFSGEAEGSCHFKIENGKIQAAMGSAEKPDLTIEAPFSVWMDIMTRKADGQQMFMEQRYKVSGDFALLLRMNQLFGRK